MKAVSLGDLRNLDKNLELKNRFSYFMTQKYKDLGDVEASKYFNENPEFRRLLKFIRKWTLEILDVLNFLDVKNNLNKDWMFVWYPWQDIADFAEQMVRYIKIWEKIIGRFNDWEVNIVQWWGTTTQDIINSFQQKITIEDDEYKRSQKYADDEKKRQVRAEKRKKARE